jgi:hypothetical protein
MIHRTSVLERATIRDVLRAVGVAPSIDPRKLIRCPLPQHEDPRPSFRVFASGYVCFGGCGKGGILDLVMALGKASDRAAAARLETIL